MTPLDKTIKAFEDAETAFFIWDLFLGSEEGKGPFPGSEAVVARALILAAFTNFEAEVNQRCETLIRDNIGPFKMRERRAWNDLAKRDVQNIHFKTRLGLLIEPGRVEFGRAVKLYEIRNKLAHGADFEVEEDFLTVATALKDILAAMEENP